MRVQFETVEVERGDERGCKRAIANESRSYVYLFWSNFVACKLVFLNSEVGVVCYY